MCLLRRRVLSSWHGRRSVHCTLRRACWEKKYMQKKKKIRTNQYPKCILGCPDGPKPGTSGCPETERSGAQSPHGLGEVREELGGLQGQADFKLHKGTTTAPGIATFPLTPPQGFPRRTRHHPYHRHTNTRTKTKPGCPFPGAGTACGASDPSSSTPAKAGHACIFFP